MRSHTLTLPFCHLTFKAPKPLPSDYPLQIESLGDHIRKRRIDLKILQKEAAKKIGVDETTIWFWENNRVECDRYRVIDHLDILYCTLNELQAHEAEIEDSFLSETEMNIKVKSQKLQDFVRDKDDLITGGLFFTNSETGHKALRVEPRMFRVKCSNGMIVEEFKTREVHIENGDELSDEMTYLSIRRSIRELFSKFGMIIQTLRESTEIKINILLRVISNVVQQYKLSEIQKENILIAFGVEPELDKYGITNAITLAAQKEETWEKSVELEKIGGSLISLPIEEFKSLDG